MVPALLLELLPLCLLGGEEWRETMNEVIWTVREEERIEMEESINITSGVEWAENQVTSSSTSPTPPHCSLPHHGLQGWEGRYRGRGERW